MSSKRPARSKRPLASPPSFTRPMLKWAGGKFRLLPTLLPKLPPGGRLFEPFVGAGSVFLNAGYERNIVADINPHLINLYLQVRDHLDAFIAEGQALFSSRYNNLAAFKRLRAEFNANRSARTVRQAALMLYLNKRAFNGLYRESANGAFNVPFGKTKGAFPLAEVMHFHAVSQRTEFRNVDFEQALADCRSGDVVFCDPPYVPLSETANFTSYAAGGFTALDQERLANLAEQLAARGVTVVITNHDTRFTRRIYQQARRHYVQVNRSISCKGAQRCAVREVIAVFRAAPSHERSLAA